jgi:molecular chaperone DnaJ
VPKLNGGPVKLKLPAGTQPGRTFLVKGKGPSLKEGRSDLLVTVQVAVPSRLSKEGRELLRDFDKVEDASVRADLELFIAEEGHDG